jgi:hypothetical protein
MVRQVRCKGVFVELAFSGLASMYPVSDWSCFAPDHYGYQRAFDLISGQASTGHSDRQCSHAPGRPMLHLLSSRRPRRVKGVGLRYRLSFQCHRLSGGLAGCAKFCRLEVSPVRKNAPGDTGQFIGQRNRQHVAVQLLLAASIQNLSPWRPAFRLDQHHPRRLHEQNPQVAVTSLDILPRIVRSPVEICLGTRPRQAAKSRPLENTSPAPIAATIALEMIGPIPGTLISRSQLARDSFDLLRRTLDGRSSSRRNLWPDLQ